MVVVVLLAAFRTLRAPHVNWRMPGALPYYGHYKLHTPHAAWRACTPWDGVWGEEKKGGVAGGETKGVTYPQGCN